MTAPLRRNEPCPCGSGRKYKHCCGKTAAIPKRPLPAAARAGVPHEDALAALESASRSLPGDVQVHYLLGQALEERGLLERAAESFGRATALRPDFADAHNDLGEVLLRLGRVDAAVASCARALALRPNFAAALGNLANAERARGALAAAIAGYRRVITLEPGLAEAHRNLGSALLEAGEREEAIASLRRAIELRPEFHAAVMQLARALTAVGRGAEAIPHYEQLLARNPGSDILDEFAALLARLGRYEAAANGYRGLLARAPGNARLHANLGHVLHCLGDFRAAIEHCGRAIELERRLPEAHLHLGNSLLALNALPEADAAYRAGLEIAPDHAALHTARAMAERALGRIEDAQASARRAFALRPDAADTLALLGSLAIDHGRFDEAEEWLRRALDIDPGLPEALTSLATLRKMSRADVPWRDAAERALAGGLPVAHAINLHHALGKYYDDVDDPDAAFRHHLTANDIARRCRQRYDRADMAQRVTRILAAFDGKALAVLRRGGLASERPVFVVGMPRSGTSLTEQILASHPQVHGAGELLYWIFAADAERAANAESAANSERAAKPGQRAVNAEQRAAVIADLGRAYLEGLAARAPDASRVVDKLPVNFMNAGLIHAALPGARFIHLERNALDTCLSIYFQGFSAAHPYATDFGDLAHYYHEYRRLMAHWRSVLPPQTLLEVRYEDLVDDPEGWTRRMLAHIGLPWDPRCLEFHRTDRPVLTASNWQVRQPIGKGSVGRWRRYERFIGPLREALGEALHRT
jgi:tetratricopeptide (TPR) repeat protein